MSKVALEVPVHALLVGDAIESTGATVQSLWTNKSSLTVTVVWSTKSGNVLLSYPISRIERIVREVQ